MCRGRWVLGGQSLIATLPSYVRRSLLVVCLSLLCGVCEMSPGSLLKRAFIDPGQCETFCLSTGFQVRPSV